MLKLLKVSIFLLLLMSSFMANAQKEVMASHSATDSIVVGAIVYNGDTIPAKTLGSVDVISVLDEAKMSERAKYNRLRNAVYVTYPYARRAGSVMNEINGMLVGVSDKKKRKEIIDSREAALKKEFTKPLTDLSVYQGKVLMKLINRETGNNCYAIIKEYKGGFTARAYQTVAFFFNSNLKQSYNASTDDAVIEGFVKEVQRMYGFNEIKAQSL